MKRKGMAIPIVLIFATIMGIVSLFLFKSAKNYNRQNLTSFAQLQSYFVARAGVEHAMLKIKYLNRELYDAICLSQGRNPLFDFSQITDINNPWSAIKQYNPGPIFLYKLDEFTNIKGVSTVDFKRDSNDGNDKNIHRKWIEVFESDITSISDKNNKDNNNNVFNGKTINTVVDFANETHMGNIKNLMREPFKIAQYYISDLGISASEIKENSGKVDNNVIVEFKINSILKTARDEDFNFEIKKTVRVSRD